MSRQALIDNAVGFLTDPSVQSSPISSRITFLEKKGLSSTEIDEALAKAGLSRPDQPNASIKQLSSQLAPSGGHGEPPASLKALATGKGGFTWKRILVFVAVLSGALATFNIPSATKFIKRLLGRLKAYLKFLLYGEEPRSSFSRIASPTSSISLDGLSELREEMAELKSGLTTINKTIETEVMEEVKQVRNTIKFAYDKLEGDIEELRTAIQAN